ncbi:MULTISPECIES: SDR family oxidoreductase [unclassified Virgibacillus]|uniref:SDR family NAD(P)-dependent oxidoreductase n=1 Tax=unclassified Virgibacillus TaxID=2620237 RepID=UPI0024DEEE50|nr:SDR family oxidoreductase [Virgibacillus sp. LDC-1]
MNKRIKDKKIIVTGASSGLGKEIAWKIAANGGVPIMISRSMDKMQLEMEQIKTTYGIQSYCYEADLEDEGAIEAIVYTIIEEQQTIHALINNAGIGFFQYIKEMEWKQVERMFQLNTFAVMHLTRLLLPHFLARKEGHFITVASQAAKLATPKASYYAASKHAILGYTNALRLELSKDPIKVTAVNLGPVRTNFFAVADPEGTYVKNIEKYMLDPEQVAIKIVNRLFTNKREINMPYWMELGSKLHYLFPNIMETLLHKQFHQK